MKIQIEEADLRSVLEALELRCSENSEEREPYGAITICKQALEKQMTDKKTEALKLAMKKAFDLGKRYWSWADSEYSSHWKKADAAKEQFNQLVEDTIREELADQPAQEDPCPGCRKGRVCRTPKCGRLKLPADHPFRSEQPAQDQGQSCYCPECERLSKELDAIKAQQPVAHMNGNGVVRAVPYPWGDKEVLTPLYPHPPASKPLTDEQILNLVPGLQDCLCDPWDYNNSGDYYASIPKDMIRLARAIEAAHGIKENT